jgi:agmatine/peptidylarginine deiminase
MDGVILSYHTGYSANILTIVRQMAVAISTTGQARVYIDFLSAASRDSTLPLLQSAGADMSRIVPIVSNLNSIWIRDYGPRYIYEGDCRAIVDHTYNRPTRTTDNNFPIVFGALRHHAVYTLPLIHGGGNYHLSSLGQGNATRLIVNENPTLTESQIIGYWQQYQNVTTTLHTPFPTIIDATQHIDMWTQVMADDKVMVSDWPSNPGSTQDVICDNAAANTFPSLGYQVFRIPAFTIGGTHYTYTNVVMCNDLVLIPSYSNTTVAPHNAEALAAFQAALPGKSIQQIDCEAIVGLAGVMHCICMHVPRFRGLPDATGFAPTAYLRTPNGGAGVVYTPGSALPIQWITDDDNAVTNVDLQLSFDSGATWPVTIAAATTDGGQHTWVVPNYFSRTARLRVLARDADGRTGFDASDADFTIAGTCRADFNNSLTLTVQDIFDFLAAYFAGDARADLNDSGNITVQDIFDFLAEYFAACA